MNRSPGRLRRWGAALAAPAVLACLAVPAAAAEAGAAAPGTPAALEAFIDGLMADHLERFAIAGASVTVVKDGELFLSKGYGHADVAAGVPVEAAATLFPTGSTAKLFTWTAVMQLVERGEIDLDADVNEYLSAFRIADTFPEPVRVRDLVSHTAGFEDKPVVGLMSHTAEVPDLESALVRFMPERVWEPGRYTAYSNYGAALAAYVVAEVSGMSWEDYLDSFVFEPLGMTRSSVRQPIPHDLTGGLTKVYTSDTGEPVEAPFEYVSIAPSGGMVATTQDMGNFMIAHLQHGRFGEARILEEATAQQMHSQLFTHDARLSGNAHGFWESSEHGQRVLSHGGDLDSSHTVLALVPEHDLGFYVAYNSHGGVPAREEFWAAFWDHALPPAPHPSPEPAVEPAPDIGRFAGTYGSNRVSTTTPAELFKLFAVLTVSAENGMLSTDLAGLVRQQWVAVGANEFREVGGPGRLVFGEDAGGRASHVFLDGLPVAASPQTAFGPIAWSDGAALHGGALAVSVLLVLSSLLLWPVLALKQRHRPATNARGARLARGWAAATGVLYLAFVVLLVAVLADYNAVEYGLTTMLAIALTVGLVAAALSLGALLHTVLAWRNGYWGVAGRVHYSLVTLAFISLAWQLNHWNLLGFHV